MKQKMMVVILLMSLLWVTGNAAPEQPLQVKKKAAFRYVYMPFTGSYKTMPQKIQQFTTEFFKQGLQPNGSLISCYHNSPEQVAESELKWDIGFPVAENVSVKAPLKIGMYQQKNVLEYLHKGPYEDLPRVYEKLKQFLDRKGLDLSLPTYEFYLNSPLEVKPQELMTRIEIPVKQK